MTRLTGLRAHVFYFISNKAWFHKFLVFSTIRIFQRITNHSKGEKKSKKPHFWPMPSFFPSDNVMNFSFISCVVTRLFIAVPFTSATAVQETAYSEETWKAAKYNVCFNVHFGKSYYLFLENEADVMGLSRCFQKNILDQTNIHTRLFKISRLVLIRGLTMTFNLRLVIY